MKNRLERTIVIWSEKLGRPLTSCGGLVSFLPTQMRIAISMAEQEQFAGAHLGADWKAKELTGEQVAELREKYGAKRCSLRN